MGVMNKDMGFLPCVLITLRYRGKKKAVAWISIFEIKQHSCSWDNDAVSSMLLAKLLCAVARLLDLHFELVRSYRFLEDRAT